jgi:hypothetical protein
VDPNTNRGVCTPPPDRGQTCGVGEIQGSCNDERDTCDVTAHVCTPTPVIPIPAPGPGESCEPLSPADECLADLACDAATARCALPSGGSCR